MTGLRKSRIDQENPAAFQGERSGDMAPMKLFPSLGMALVKRNVFFSSLRPNSLREARNVRIASAAREEEA